MEKAMESARSVVNVLIAEANQMNCQLVENAIRPRRFKLTVVASTVESSRALALLKQFEPDVALISSQLHEGPLAGFRVLREMKAYRLKTRAVILLEAHKRELVIDAFRNGAHGVVFRDESLETLSKCLHAVHQGQIWADSQNLNFVVDALGESRSINLQDARGTQILSKREERVARLVVDGFTNRQISEQLSLSEHTVRNYIFKIFDKVGVSSRVELVLYCLQGKNGNSHSELTN
jgi:DNA-binding NarL/FixJ family response regulator